jgi:SPP1 gp7 family putative phage head morphogenesis protein
MTPATHPPPAPRPHRRTRRAAFVALAARHAVEATTLADAPRAALRPVLAVAATDTQRDLATYLRAQPDPDARYTAKQYAATLAALAFALAALRRVAPALDTALGRMTVAAGVLAARHLTGQLAALGTTTAPALSRLLAPTPAARLAHVTATAERFAARAADDLRATLALGMVRGETVADLTTRLRGPGLAPPAAPLFRQLDGAAERLIRTEAAAAYSDAMSAGLLEARAHIPDLVKRWDASADSHVCPTCAELDGQVAALEDDFPGGYDRPPVHANCRCTLSAWRASWGAAA